MLQIYDRVLTSRSLPTLTMLSLGMIVALLVYTVLETLRSRILVQAGLALDSLISPQALTELFTKEKHTHHYPPHQSPSRDIATVRQYLTGNGIFAFFDAPWAVVFLAIIFLMHWMLGVTALVGMIALLLLAILDEKKTRHLLLEANALSRESNHYVDTSLRSKDVIVAMGMREEVIHRWQHTNQKVLNAQADASDKSGLYLASTKGIRTLLQTVMLGLGAYLVITENLSSGIMIAATILLGKATAPIEIAIAGWKGFIDARASYQRLDKLLSSTDTTNQNISLPEPKGNISLDKVIFRTSDSTPPILKGVSFAIDAGESIAIIGPSAAGKSSLLKIILGIWRPSSGEVRIDGANVSTWSELALGPYMGYLPQDIQLMTGTVAENIARMQHAKEHSEQIIHAAKLAGAHEMILKLPHGYETPLANNGDILSGGQKQRIALARALYKQPKIIILDEPNSNLDNDGEIALIEALKQIKTIGSTVILVTHKPSLINYVDKLMILESGSIIAFDKKETVFAQMQAKAKSIHNIKPTQKAS